MEESLATLLPAVPWKIRNITTELHFLAKKISRQNTESATWLLTGHEKMQNQRDELKNKLSSFQSKFRRNRKEPGLAELEIKTLSPAAQPLQMAKYS